jgi:hypothetical protein
MGKCEISYIYTEGDRGEEHFPGETAGRAPGGIGVRAPPSPAGWRPAAPVCPGRGRGSRGPPRAWRAHPRDVLDPGAGDVACCTARTKACISPKFRFETAQ